MTLLAASYSTQRRGNGKIGDEIPTIHLEWCKDGEPHLPILDPESGVEYCGNCGFQFSGLTLERDLGREVEQDFPDASKQLMGTGKFGAAGLGSDLNKGAYELAGVGLKNSRREIAHMQLHGEMEEAGNTSEQRRVNGDNNQIAPAAKQDLRNRIRREKVRRGELVHDEVKRIVSRLLEQMHKKGMLPYGPNTRAGLELDNAIVDQAIVEVGELQTTLFMQRPSEIPKVVQGLGDHTLVFNCVLVAFDKRFPKQLLNPIPAGGS